MTPWTPDNPNIILPYGAPREQWLATRRLGIGGSDIGKIVLGQVYQDTDHDVFLEKIGEAEPKEETLAMKRGTILEPLVLSEYARDEGRTLLPNPGTLRHPDYPWALCNPDGIGTQRGVEAKTADFPFGWGEPGTDQIPEPYLLQCHWCLWVTNAALGLDLEAWDCAVLIPGRKSVTVYTVWPDPVMTDLLRQAGEEFWDKVQRRDPPTRAKPYKTKIRKKDAVAVTADDKAMDHYRRLKEIHPQHKALESEVEELKGYLKRYMGEADALVDESDTLLATYKESKAGTMVDTKAMAADHPDIVEKYTVEKKPSRPFLPKF